jgi:hypothetical protein
MVHYILPGTSTPKEKIQTTTVFDLLSATNIHWYEDGLVYQDEVVDSATVGSKGGTKMKKLEAKLCRVSAYRWVKPGTPFGFVPAVKVEEVETQHT